MYRGGGGAYGNSAITGGVAAFDAGAVATPSLKLSGTTGWYARGANTWTWSDATNPQLELTGSNVIIASGATLAWSSSGVTGSADIALSRAGANSLRFGGTGAASTLTARTELNKPVAAIANNVATDVLTVTIPNAAHSASLLVRVTGSLGAGGAIGANEATATNSYVIPITRTAGVATVTAISAAFGASAVAVAGAATVTCVATVTAMTGAIGAQQTFTVQVTIVRSGGSSDNHTCLVYAQLMNANATGISIA